MPVWKRLWLLFSVIWVVVGALKIVTFAIFGEPGLGQFVQPVILTLAVPAVVYALIGSWAHWRARRKGDG